MSTRHGWSSGTFRLRRSAICSVTRLSLTTERYDNDSRLDCVGRRAPDAKNPQKHGRFKNIEDFRQLNAVMLSVEPAAPQPSVRGQIWCSSSSIS